MLDDFFKWLFSEGVPVWFVLFLYLVVFAYIVWLLRIHRRGLDAALEAGAE